MISWVVGVLVILYILLHVFIIFVTIVELLNLLVIYKEKIVKYIWKRGEINGN